MKPNLEPFEVGIDTVAPTGEPSRFYPNCNTGCRNDQVFINPRYQQQETNETVDFAALDKEIKAEENIGAEINWRITMWGSLALMAVINTVKGVEDAVAEPTPGRVALAAGAAALSTAAGFLTRKAVRAGRVFQAF